LRFTFVAAAYHPSTLTPQVLRRVPRNAGELFTQPSFWRLLTRSSSFISFHISANRQVNFNLLFRQLFNFPNHLQECGIRSGFIGDESLGKKGRGRFKNLTFLPKENILFSVGNYFLRRRGILMNRAKKLTEEEISWLMNVLTPGDCKSCIWREREEEKFRCFPNGDSPCKVFIDKVFQSLESADLI
jgi:hypothetical protein